jgi:hypothetical protein
MGADLGVLARRPRPSGDGAASHKRDRVWQRHVRSPNSAVFSPSQHVRPARCRPYPCWATDRRVLEGYRRVDQHIAGPGQSAASLGGLGCLQAAPVVLPGDRRHGVRILVRVRVCAPKQPSATAAVLDLGAQSQHVITSPGGRPERDHLDQASMLSHGNSLPYAPGAAACVTQMSARRPFQPRCPGRRRGATA